MLRGDVVEKIGYDPEFRWRGTDVSRIENLSDIVFAIAFGMIVTAATPPTSFEDLTFLVWNIIPVGAAFVILVTIWQYHYKFFRRVGLITPRIVWLNALLLFTVLYMAYPLRFSFEGFFAFMQTMTGNNERVVDMQLSWQRSGQTMALFSIGFGVVHLIMSAMQAHALSLAEALDFSVEERRILLSEKVFHLGFALNAALITVLALATPLYGMAGFLFFLSWPIGVFAERWARRRIARISPSRP